MATRATTLATTRSYDAIVLDIMLPGRDGLSILRNLRDRHSSVPVILLTARSALNERLDGLNLGADDYLTKPFYIEELVARLHALCAAPPASRKTSSSTAKVTVNLLTREVKHGAKTVELTAREFALLTYLLAFAGTDLHAAPRFASTSGTTTSIPARISWMCMCSASARNWAAMPAIRSSRPCAASATGSGRGVTPRVNPNSFRLKIALLSGLITGLLLVGIGLVLWGSLTGFNSRASTGKSATSARHNWNA